MAEQNNPARPAGNGRRTVAIVVGVAFLASVTTLILALTASHGARQRDAVAITEDSNDLQGVVSDWQAQVAQASALPDGQRDAAIDGLKQRADAASAWKPRTPCGQEARDRLRAAMDTRITSLARVTPGTVQDEMGIVDDALRTCAAQAGRDVPG
ncbi:hypothetical protein [Luteibacter yeojuensis]|uniref:Uncharacterized protein n=1 Tax=Luteibacter yeojuensis TaxID=345309 RepID=A0A0F3KYM3_9GAMM|nr:hypothetical protein [Luteibacter yeojuensis]KJV36256.1 hypothetical protein VI08_05210 [Luteibacter yeojuensis]